MPEKTECVLFDLDSTLYSVRFGLEKAMSRRVNDFVARLLAISPEDAQSLRRARVLAAGYGTTLEWLLAEQGLDAAGAEAYLRFIHPEDEADSLPPDPELSPFLAALDRPLAILTNSPMEHAARILEKLGVAGCFTAVFDIRGNGFRGKPRPEAFRRALDAIGVRAENCLFVDDSSRYVEGFRALGGMGVYYDELDAHPEYAFPRITRLQDLREFVY